MSSLRQPSLWLSPDRPTSFSDQHDTSPTIIPRTPVKNRSGAGNSASRMLLPAFSRSRSRSREETENLAHILPRWCEDSNYSRDPSPTPSTQSSTLSGRSGSHSRKEKSTPISSSPGSSASTSDTSLLREILKQVQSLEKEVQDMKEAGTNHPTRKRKKVAPSPEIRLSVRKIFKMLEEEDENFGWNNEVGFADKSNQEIVSRIVTEVKSHLPGVSSVTVKDAARTYFNSVLGTSRLKTSGKYDAKVMRQRRRNRLIRKLKKRQATFLKTKGLSDAQKEKWRPSLVIEMMSSEESGSDDESPQFVIRPLPWRNQKVDVLFANLDGKTVRNRSKKSTIMTISRSKGVSSDRPRPVHLPAILLN